MLRMERYLVSAIFHNVVLWMGFCCASDIPCHVLCLMYSFPSMQTPILHARMNALVMVLPYLWSDLVWYDVLHSKCDITIRIQFHRPFWETCYKSICVKPVTHKICSIRFICPSLILTSHISITPTFLGRIPVQAKWNFCTRRVSPLVALLFTRWWCHQKWMKFIGLRFSPLVSITIEWEIRGWFL